MPALPVPRESTLCRIRSTKAAAQNRWIAYNRMRGQHSSAMEHATPEQFWIDRNQCRYVEENGQIKNATLPDCGQAVSAVKALAIAQQQGQKIYTITPQNASAALAKLPISGSVGQEIRNAVQAGKEVTIHEKPINAYGWTGYGYSIIDPETGEGGYILEGSGNGGWLEVFTPLVLAIIFAISIAIGGWLIALLEWNIIAESLLAIYALSVNYLYQQRVGLDNMGEIHTSFAELLAAYVLLTMSLFLGSHLLVVAAIIAVFGGFLGLLWDIIVHNDLFEKDSVLV